MEPGRDDVERLLEESDLAATSRLSYVECRAAFARAVRERRSTPAEDRRITREFDALRAGLHVVEMDESISLRAAELARTHALRAGDAIHLASASLITFRDPANTVFACWDGRLWRAASAAGFQLLPEAAPRR